MSKKSSTKTGSKKKLTKKSYTLKQPVTFGGKEYKRGDKVSLTEEGRAYFLSIKKI